MTKASRYSDDDVLQALRAAAAAQGEPLSVDRYDAHQARAGGPTSARIIQRHGTWNAACAAAALRVNASRAGSRRRWTPNAVAAHVAAYLREEGSGSYAGYADWAKRTEGAPSAQTVRNTFSGWAAAKDAATGRDGTDAARD